jgi:hypothetical protein
VIKEVTHEPLITSAEEEALLANLDRRRGERNYRTSRHALAVESSTRRPAYHGTPTAARPLGYRCPMRRVPKGILERAVLKKIARAFKSMTFAQRLAPSARIDGA